MIAVRLLCALFVLASAERALAQAPQPGASQSTLLIVRSAGDENLAQRTCAELGTSDWRVVQIGPDAELARVRLSDLARAHGAVAAIRMNTEHRELELWVAGAQPAADASTDLLSTAGSSDGELSLRVVETLRARTLALQGTQQTSGSNDSATPEAPATAAPTNESAAPEPRSEASAGGKGATEPTAVAATGSVEDRTQRSYPRLSLELAPAAAYSPGGLAPAFGGWLAVRVQPASLWSIAGFALAPLWSARLQASEGSASTSLLLLGAGAFLHVIQSPFELDLGVGLGSAMMFTSGDARAPYTSNHDTILAPAPLAIPSLHLQLGGPFRAFARAIVGTTLPRMTIRFGDSDAAHWGTPFIAGIVGLEIALLGGTRSRATAGRDRTALTQGKPASSVPAFFSSSGGRAATIEDGYAGRSDPRD